MNKRDSDRRDAAFERGKLAFLAGKKLSDCPYKHSAWGLGAAWDHGWSTAKNEADQRRKEMPDWVRSF